MFRDSKVIKHPRFGKLFDNASGRGSTPLIIATQNGHCEVVQHLLAAGADKAGTAGGKGYIACEGRQMEYCANELFLQNCEPKLDVVP